MSWPTLEELKQTLDVTTDDWDGASHLQGVLDAAIENVKLDVGDWDDETDVADAKLSRAAMLLAVRIAKAPSQAPSDAARSDPDYAHLLKGRRRRFAIG
jgi:formiminotetrahydrofolate cyclodeaminase